MYDLNRIPLSGLRAVEAVARLGTLAQAARELGVSLGAVSQRIARTEAALGQKLFERRAAGMVPTALGTEMAAELSPGFAHLAAAARLARRDRRHTLVISVAPIFAARWLIWRLPRFSARHPEIRLRLEAQVALTEPGLSDVDLALRVGPGGWKGVRAEHLWEQRVTPVCAPAVAARLERPEDLAGVPIIRDVNSMYGWECWLAPEGLDEALLGPGPEFSDGSLCLDAAISGAGVFLSWETLHSHALATGQLVAPFGRRHPTGQGYWLVSAAERGLGPAQSHFRRWLKQELAADGIISDPRR